MKKQENSINHKRRKTYFTIVGIQAAILLSVCTGCHAGYQQTKEAKQEIESMSTAMQETAEQEPSGSFKVTYQGEEAANEIELRQSELIYDADEIRIYAHYIYDLFVPATFPSNQYVLYFLTPMEQTQLYPVADFLVDKEHKTLYTKIKGDNGFECVQFLSLTPKDHSILETKKELFHQKQAEAMLCDAFEKAASGFSDITVELTETKTGSAGILCGATGGIEKATGQWYYVDWEIDLSDNTQSLTPCILKQYDPDKDKEIFAESSRIFDQIEQGDWSGVNPAPDTGYQREGLEYLWGPVDGGEGIRMDVNVDRGEWIRMDVNGDGLPELLNGWEVVDVDEDVKKISVTFIFTYKENAAELVYIDINDGMEYLYITGNGNLVYEWSVSGGPCTNIQRLCQFDLKWEKKYLDTLVRYRFPEEEGELAEYYREYFPDTYGVGGEGVYYLRERPKTQKELEKNEDGKYTVREYLTEEQFLNIYKEMTGWDFYASQYMY